MQALRSSGTSAIRSIQPIPLPEPITTSPIDLLQPSGQKQKQCSADEPALERPQTDLSSVKDSWQPLSLENVHTRNRLTRSTPPYDIHTLSLRTPDRSDHKRSASRQSSVSGRSMESIAASRRSSRSAAHYRWRILREARISVCSKPLPEAVTERINGIFGREISDKRRGDLQCIAKHLCNNFVHILSGDSHVDEYVASIRRALSSMDGSENFEILMKAGIASSPVST